MSSSKSNAASAEVPVEDLYEVNETKRPTVATMEDYLNKELRVLDHGFIRVIDYMGDDSAVVQAARVSYGKGTKTLNQDRGLIRYLLRHMHTTPFEMCEIKFHMKMPIFVARQWIRHRTANVNEYSARYSILEDDFYIPTSDNLAIQSKTNMQGRGEVLSQEEAKYVMDVLKRDADTCYSNYQKMLNLRGESDGLSRELARMNLTLNCYTQWYWKIDLHNLMHFLKLRADSHSQYEIRAYAIKMLDILKAWVPYTYEAFLDYAVNAVKLSAQGKEAIKRILAGEAVTLENCGMSKREWVELCAEFDLENLS